jgi:hypothetical protein
MESFYFQNLNEVESEEQFCAEILNRLSALENVDAKVTINRVWETIRGTD